jgi:hypothetical protein
MHRTYRSFAYPNLTALKFMSSFTFVNSQRDLSTQTGDLESVL